MHNALIGMGKYFHDRNRNYFLKDISDFWNLFSESKFSTFQLDLNT